MSKRKLAALLAVVVLTACQNQSSPGDMAALDASPSMVAISPDAIEAHMRFLADDLLEGRDTGSRGHALAARYMASEFAQLGLRPVGDDGGYYQNIRFRRAGLKEGGAHMRLSRGSATVTLTEAEHFLPVAGYMAEHAGVSGAVVFAGFGVAAPERGYDDYAGLDVSGRIVAVLGNAPTNFPSDQRAYYSSLRTKIMAATAHGAIGLILLRRPADEKRLPWARMVKGSRKARLRWLDPSGEVARDLASLGAVVLLSEEGTALLLKGAPVDLDNLLARAADNAPPRFALGLTATFDSVSTRETVSSPNVLALLPGSDPVLADEYVVFSAHLDHLGMDQGGDGDSGDKIYNGAYDNASGSALLLEIARAFATAGIRPRRSILFAAVTGEEKGLLGSDYFARHPTVPAEKIVADLNLDMLHMLHPLRDVVAFGAEHSSLGADVAVAAEALGLTVSPDPFPELVVFIRSDHYSFVRQGIPAISLFPGFETGDKNLDGAEQFEAWMANTYHQTGDDMSQPFDFAVGAAFARLYVMIGERVANADGRPSWNPGDFFGDKFSRARGTP